ncbi:MAG: hypothetical protein ACYDC6_03635 [Acidobacteriaceae bacterium]
MVILHAARTQPDAGNALKQAAEHYKVDTDAVARKVRQELAAKQKAQSAKKAEAKLQIEASKKTTAA